MKYSLAQSVSETGVSKTCILRWVEAGLLKPKKVTGPYFSAGFVYQFSESDLKKMRSMHKGRGRPSKPVEAA